MDTKEWQYHGVRVRFSGDFPAHGIARFLREAASLYQEVEQLATMTIRHDLGLGCELFITCDDYVGLKGEVVADALLIAANDVEDGLDSPVA